MFREERTFYNVANLVTLSITSFKHLSFYEFTLMYGKGYFKTDENESY